jgi:hypothetical protein
MLDKRMCDVAEAYLIERSKQSLAALKVEEIEQYVKLGGLVVEVDGSYFTEEFSTENVFYPIHHATAKRLVREGKTQIVSF